MPTASITGTLAIVMEKIRLISDDPNHWIGHSSAPSIDLGVGRYIAKNIGPAAIVPAYMAGDRPFTSGVDGFVEAIWSISGMTTLIHTIGYEATTMTDFIAALQAAGVRRVIDVRALPLSRRPGFSKTSLSAELAGYGIDYVHLKALGTPKRGRDAAKKGDVATLEAVYAEQLELPEAQAQAAIMLALAAEMPSTLLCFERNPAHCHRTLLLEAVGQGAAVIDLYA